MIACFETSTTRFRYIYRAVQTKGGVIMVRQADLISGELGGFLTITQGFPLDAKIKAQFKANGKKTAIQAIAIAVGNLADDPDAKLTEPQLVNDAAHDGYEGYVKPVPVTGQGCRQDALHPICDLTADRADVIMRVAYDSQANYAAFNAGFESLATSIEPRTAARHPRHGWRQRCHDRSGCDYAEAQTRSGAKR